MALRGCKYETIRLGVDGVMATHHSAIRPEGSLVFRGDKWIDASGNSYTTGDNVGWVPDNLTVYWEYDHEIVPQPASYVKGRAFEFGDLWVNARYPMLPPVYVYSDRGHWIKNRLPQELKRDGEANVLEDALPGDYVLSRGGLPRVINYQGVWQDGLVPYDFYLHRADRVLMSGGIDLPEEDE